MSTYHCLHPHIPITLHVRQHLIILVIERFERLLLDAVICVVCLIRIDCKRTIIEFCRDGMTVWILVYVQSPKRGLL